MIAIVVACDGGHFGQRKNAGSELMACAQEKYEAYEQRGETNYSDSRGEVIHKLAVCQNARDRERRANSPRHQHAIV